MPDASTAHSTLSFSGRERWRSCPFSVQLSKGMPDSTSPAAAEGTAAHAVAEWHVRQLGSDYGMLPATSLPACAEVALPDGVDTKGLSLDEWRAMLHTHGAAYADFVKSLVPPGEQAFVSVEVRVAARSIDPRLFGTADCLIWLPDARRLIVVDYKFGFGEVDVGTVAHPNPQLSSYAIAALDACTLEATGGVTLAVFQPRRTFGNTRQTLDLHPSWVAEERAKLAREVAAVDAATTPNPGDHCRYCKGRSKCPAVHNALAAVIQPSGAFVDLLAIPRDALIDLWAAKTAFKAFWEDVEELIEQEARNGNSRLVVNETKGRQMWADPKAAALTLMAIGRTDLLSPCALSEALPHLSEEWKEALVTRSKPGRSIKLATPVSASKIAETFAKYAKPVDKQ